MAINTYRFWMATDSNRLLANQTSFIQANAPAFYQGNVANLELHMVASAGVGVTPIEIPFPAGAEISVAVGDTNAYPTGGSWELSVDGVETAPMPYNATTAQVAAALNALASVSSAGGVSVSKTGEGYTITWNTYGLKPTIGIGSDTLTPSSYESISLVQTGSTEHRQIVFVELRQNPIALSTIWTPLPQPSITTSLVKAWDGSSVIWRVTIYPQPKAGTMTLSYGTKTATIDVASSATTIAVALEAQVFATGQYQWDIAIAEDTALLASGNLIGYNGYSGTINFATAECHQFLAGGESKNTTLEVSMSVDDKRYTILQTGCQVFADVISDGVLTPLPLGVALSEQVANARFVRRDIDQNPDAATQDVIWQNLGVETIGSDVVGALNGADSPSAANPFATISDLGSISGYATETWVTDNFYPLEGNPASFASENWVQSQGYISSLQNLTSDISWDINSQAGRLLIDGYGGPGGETSARLNFGATSPYLPVYGDFWYDGQNFLYQSGSYGTETIASRSWVNAGVTFSGKTNFTSVNGQAGLNIGIGGTSVDATVNGDLWIPTAGTNLNFRDGNGIARVCASTTSGNTFNQPQAVDASNVLPALRVTQRGSGNALLVEDSTTPDTSALVVDASGNVGVGVATGYTSTSKVEVVGNVKATTLSTGSGPTFSINSTAAHTGGTDTLDAIVTINGVNYRIGLRPA